VIISHCAYGHAQDASALAAALRVRSARIVQASQTAQDLADGLNLASLEQRRDAMSDQGQRKPPQDPVKKRREYLWLKTETAGLGSFGAAIAAASVLTTGALIYIGYRILSNAGEIADFWSCLLCLLLTVSVGSLSMWLWRLTSGRARTLAYVAPVHEQLAALSADEVLVRASNEPAAGPEELLRAARATAPEPAKELLRAELQTVNRPGRQGEVG
jgi:hypothetical protein